VNLTDSFGRRFEYLRLSVDDACNFRCLYCLPDGYKKTEPEPSLTVDEVRRLVAAFAGMGFWKVRLTGGEPTTRQDIVELAEAVARTPGVERVALSTNGYRLKELAVPLSRAGVGSVNVSVDSLIVERFKEITGHARLVEVLQAIDQCIDLGLDTKVNVVLLKGLNDDEVNAFMEYARPRKVSVRFIELMPTGSNTDFFAQRHLKTASLLPTLSAAGWVENPREPGAGPARVFNRPFYKGSMGIIAPYEKDFCSTCNRLRVTSRGRLRLCLFSEGEISLRHLLQADSQKADLQEFVRSHIGRKEVSHYLPEGKTGDAKHFAMMGG
jgi:GTP 3',8-cyclase